MKTLLVLISSHRDIIVLIQWYYSTEITITDPDKQQKHTIKKWRTVKHNWDTFSFSTEYIIKENVGNMH